MLTSFTPLDKGAQISFKWILRLYLVLFARIGPQQPSNRNHVPHHSHTRLSLLPRFHPWRANCLEYLGYWRFQHYRVSNSREQLETSILHWAEALLLPLTGIGPTVQLFFFLTCSLVLRLEKFKQTDDITYCVKYFHFLRDRQLQDIDIPHASQLMALAVWVELNSGDVTGDIKEMMTLPRIARLGRLDNQALSGFG
jgi:hypothetical protein